MLKIILKNTTDFFENIGSELFSKLSDIGYGVILFFKVIFYLKNIFQKRFDIVKQMYIAGVKSFLVVTIVSLFTGMILAFQFGIELKNFGIETRIGQLIIATLTREMSPFVSAIVLISSVGSAIAAEIATMKESEEIDALIMMSISPVKFLVMPRLVAMSIIFPLVCVYFTFFGVFGAAVIAINNLGITWNVFYKFVLAGLHFKAVYVGLLKSFVFGILVTLASCTKGLRATGGALGVGHATRSSVISSFLLVLIVGFYITTLFYG